MNFTNRAIYLLFITRPNPQNSELGTCIDNMFLKTNFININPYKFIPKITDHYPLFISITTSKEIRDSKNYHSFIDYRKLNHEANYLNWHIMSQHKDPVTALDSLIANIRTIINKAKVTKKTKKNKPRKN